METFLRIKLVVIMNLGKGVEEMQEKRKKYFEQNKNENKR